MVARHHWAIEPGIIYCSFKALIDTLGGSADVDARTVRTEAQDPLRRFDISVQSTEGDVHCREGLVR
jgi:hypothetical protein